MVLGYIFGDMIANQINRWLGEHPTETIGLGVAGLAVVDYLTGGKIYQTVLKAYDFLKDYLLQAYTIVSQALGYLFGFVSYITQTFEIDNPKRTFALSVIFFGMIIAIILLFSGTSWSKGGITNLTKKEFTMADFSGIGAIGSSGTGPDGTLQLSTTTTLNPENPPPDLNYTWINVCYIDSDCQRVYEGNALKCCNPSTYIGYTCQGQCLKDESWEPTACTHPNTCYNVNANTIERIIRDLTSCVDRGVNADSYCRSNGDLSSRCCNLDIDSLKPCWGYCTRANGTHDCNDYTQCYNEYEGF